MASYSLPGGQTASLIKRTKPLTVQEAEAVIAALNLPSEEQAYLLQQFAPLRVRELLDEGSVAQAFDLAMQLLDGDTLNSREKAAQAVSIGNQLLNMGETARAIDLLNQVAPDTDNALVWVLLGRAYAGQQNRIEAISAYEQALALDPQNYWANHLLAGLYAYREEWDAVVQLERAALQVATDDSHRVASAMRLVEAYESLGDRENACAVLQQIEQWAQEGNDGFGDLHERLECQP
jgi:tetratricopeptide (TPR) repeat protein